MKLIQNAIKIIEGEKPIYMVSVHTHHFVSHDFQAPGMNIFVDGGNDYQRRGGTALFEKGKLWVDWSLTDNDPTELIVERLLWGTRGKDGKDRLRYIPLSTCETDHLQAILDYPYPASKPLPEMYKKVIGIILHERKQPMCKCGKNPQTTFPHTCPYSEDVNNDSETMCHCCSECSYQCAMDI